MSEIRIISSGDEKIHKFQNVMVTHLTMQH